MIFDAAGFTVMACSAAALIAGCRTGRAGWFTVFLLSWLAGVALARQGIFGAGEQSW